MSGNSRLFYFLSRIGGTICNCTGPVEAVFEAGQDYQFRLQICRNTRTWQDAQEDQISNLVPAATGAGAGVCVCMLDASDRRFGIQVLRGKEGGGLLAWQPLLVGLEL